MKVMTGFWASQCLITAAKLEIADTLKEGPQHISEIALAKGLHEAHLYRVMRALSCFGIFSESDDKIFSLTPLSELLTSDHPDSMKSIAIMLGSENYQSWANLSVALTEGKSPFQHTYKSDVYSYFRNNLNAGTVFNEAMSAIAKNDAQAVISAFPFDGYNHIVDIGGGQGILLCQLLKEYPHAKATLFEQPEVIEQAIPIFRQSGLDLRCSLVSGDFFEEIPKDGDIYIMSRILHTFDDENAVRILQKVSSSLNEISELLILEWVIEPGNHPETTAAKLMDVNMMVFAANGKDRTLKELEELFMAAGLKINRTLKCSTGIHCFALVKDF